jgi:hypothetical protein
MGYGYKAETVQARLDLLDDLIKGRPTVWTTEPDPAITRRLANQIREALYIAHTYHPNMFPELAVAYDLFSIHIVSDGRIEARFKVSAEVQSNRTDLHTPVHGLVTPNHGFKLVPQVGISTAQECIDSWQAHLPSSDPVLLSRTTLDENELWKLWTFCSRNTPRLMMLVGPDHITISLYEMETATIAAWNPPAVEPATVEEFDL